MQSLPTALTTAQLEGILSALAALPSATVNRHPDVITVTATRTKTAESEQGMSAAPRDRLNWHVLTAPGLLTPPFTN